MTGTPPNLSLAIERGWSAAVALALSSPGRPLAGLPGAGAVMAAVLDSSQGMLDTSPCAMVAVTSSGTLCPGASVTGGCAQENAAGPPVQVHGAEKVGFPLSLPSVSLMVIGPLNGFVPLLVTATEYLHCWALPGAGVQGPPALLTDRFDWAA